jgi:hypothetical protein
MQERKPVLYIADSIDEGQLESKLSLYHILMQPIERYLDAHNLFRPRRNPTYENARNKIYSLKHPQETKLFELLVSNETNVLKREDILREIFPEVTQWLILKDEMANTFIAEERIAILKHALDKGFELSAEDTPLLLSIENSQDYPEVIKFFFDHESCTAKHIMSFLNRYRSTSEELSMLTITHPKFPSTREEYVALRRWNILGFGPKYSYSKKDPIALFQTAIIMLTHRPKLISFAELKGLRRAFVNTYHYYDCPAEIKPILRKGIYLVCNHPETSLLYSDDQYNRDYGKYGYDFFEEAATCGDVNLFDLIYSHEDTTNEAREKCLKVAIANKDAGFINDFSFGLTKVHYEKHLTLFFLGMMNTNELPKELILLISKIFIDSAQDECITSITINKKLPSSYTKENNHALTLFQKIPVSDEWLIERVIIGIQNYLDAKPTPTEKGKNRGVCLIRLLENASLSTSCKLMIADTALSEETYSESRVKQYLNKVVGQYTCAIKKIAVEYADGLNLDLKKLGDNLTYYIHKKYITDRAGWISENELIKEVGQNARATTSNTRK